MPDKIANEAAFKLLAGETTSEVEKAELATAIGLGSIDDVSDSNKPVSTPQQTALDLKANLASPSLTGVPSAPSADTSTNTTQLATTAFVQSRVSEVIGLAPDALDTLAELGDALSDDANFAGTVTTALGLKAAIASPTFTGTVGGITKSMVGLGNVNNTTDLLKPVSAAQQTALDLKADDADLNTHISDATNPHAVTKAQVGLGSAENTTDLLKPVSTATQTARPFGCAIY